MEIGAGRMVRWAVSDGRVRRAGGARMGPGHASGFPVMWSGLVELEPVRADPRDEEQRRYPAGSPERSEGNSGMGSGAARSKAGD